MVPLTGTVDAMLLADNTVTTSLAPLKVSDVEPAMYVPVMDTEVPTARNDGMHQLALMET